MAYTVEEGIIKRAYLCPRDHVCLTGNDGLYCKVAVLMKGAREGEEEALVDCTKNADDCPYLKKFGGTYICGCPVRREIYKSYGA